MNVSLTPELEQLIEAKLASGMYKNAAEVVREVDRLRLDTLRATFGRLGFTGDELELRCRMFLYYELADPQILADTSPELRLSLADLRLKLLTSPGWPVAACGRGRTSTAPHGSSRSRNARRTRVARTACRTRGTLATSRRSRHCAP